jgi:hypothetical protein
MATYILALTALKISLLIGGKNPGACKAVFPRAAPL